jgi:hypothetical protein
VDGDGYVRARPVPEHLCVWQSVDVREFRATQQGNDHRRGLNSSPFLAYWAMLVLERFCAHDKRPKCVRRTSEQLKPEMTIELGPEHEELIEELYALRDRIEMSRSERLVVNMAIQMIEYMDGYVADEPVGNAAMLSDAEGRAPLDRYIAPQRPTKIQFTADDFHDLICSGGYEVSAGRLIPRIR